MGAGDSEAGEKGDGDRKMTREPASDVGACLLVLDFSCDERVVARDVVVGVSGDECTSGITTLALAGVGAQPAIQTLLAAVEGLDAMSSAVERRDRGQPLRHAEGRTLGF
jgi:hypothetical protein